MAVSGFVVVSAVDGFMAVLAFALGVSVVPYFLEVPSLLAHEHWTAIEAATHDCRSMCLVCRCVGSLLFGLGCFSASSTWLGVLQCDFCLDNRVNQPIQNASINVQLDPCGPVPRVT